VPKAFSYGAALAATSIALATISSCKARQDDTAARGADTSVAGNAAAPGDTAMPGSTGGLTDANIVFLLDEANMADSASGAYALGKATSPDVKAFGKLMMAEHHALRIQGQQLAKQLNVTPQAPADDPLKPAAQSEMDALKAAPKGQQFDRTYIEQEIGMHKAVLDLANKAHDAAQSPELKQLIEKAGPVIQRHLDRAEEIQKKLGRPSA
jgi:putative membrane protein